MGDLPDELAQARDVVDCLRNHPAVVPQSVDVDAHAHDFTDLTFRCRLKRADSDTTERE